MPFSAVLVTSTGTFLIRSRAVLLWCEGCGLLCCFRWCSGSLCRVLGGVPLLGAGCSFLLMDRGSGLCFRPSVVAVRLGFPRFVCCLLGGVFFCVVLWFCLVVLGLSLLGFVAVVGVVLVFLFSPLSLSLFFSSCFCFLGLCLLVMGWLWFLVCGFWVGVWGCGGFLLVGPLHACPGCSCALALVSAVFVDVVVLAVT